MWSVGIHLNRRINRQSRGKKVNYKTAGEAQTYGKGLCQGRKNEKKSKQRFSKRRPRKQSRREVREVCG